MHEALKERPILSLSVAAARTSLSFPTVSAAMNRLVDMGIALEITGKSRDRLFAYDNYIAMLNEDNEAT